VGFECELYVGQIAATPSWIGVGGEQLQDHVILDSRDPHSQPLDRAVLRLVEGDRERAFAIPRRSDRGDFDDRGPPASGEAPCMWRSFDLDESSLMHHVLRQRLRIDEDDVDVPRARRAYSYVAVRATDDHEGDFGPPSGAYECPEGCAVTDGAQAATGMRSVGFAVIGGMQQDVHAAQDRITPIDLLPRFRGPTGRSRSPAASAKGRTALDLDAQGRKLKMADELFGDRRKALEEAFFAKQNEKVKQQLRAKHQGQARREALAAASGIRDEGVLDKLVALGLGAETLAALSLVPLVEVAWADGTIDAKERAAILAGIEKQGIAPASAAHELLEGWLSKRPDRQLLLAWKDYVKALAAGLDAGALGALRSDLIGRARAVAEAAGGFLGVGSKISKAEESVLRDLEQSFG
jgi:hypothetical protein